MGRYLLVNVLEYQYGIDPTKADSDSDGLSDGWELAHSLDPSWAGDGVGVVAGFTATPTNGSVPLTVVFTDSSTGTITNRLWNFGDGTSYSATGTNVSHTYTNAGSYTVSLVVSGPSGASTRTVSNAIQATCGVIFTTQPDSRAAVPGSSVTFSAKVTTGTMQTNYQWQFQGSPIAGASKATLALTNVQATNFGTYSVTVNNGTCSAVSSNAILTLAASPELTLHSLNGMTLSLLVPTEVGPQYFLECKNSLNATSWTALYILSGDGTTYMLTDSTANSRARFYRIRIQ